MTSLAIQPIQPTKRHPFDRDLQKGERICQAEIEEIVGVKYDDNPARYQTEMLKLCGKIEILFEIKGVVITTTTNINDIIVCSDSLALAVNLRRFKAGVRAIVKSCYKAKHIDVANLSSDEKKFHAKFLVFAGQTVNALPKKREFQL